MSCSNEKTALRATTAFACIYILSGVFISCVGVYALVHLPELFTTGSVIWSGIVVSCLGVTAMLYACSGSVTFQKGMIIAVIAGVVMVTCIINIVLLETIEWKYGVPPLPIDDPEKEVEREFLFFLTCLFSLFGTVLALVASICNLLYAYCILLIPLKQLAKKRDILQEKVTLYNSVKVQSPRSIPEEKNNIPNKSRKSLQSPGQFTPSGLPKTSTDHKVHNWVYNNDISSEISVSSQGTEMTANKAFLKELLESPMLATVVLTPEEPVATPASNCHGSDKKSDSDKKEVPTITVSNETPYQRKKIGDSHEKSTFSGGSSAGTSTNSEGNQDPLSPLSEGSGETSPTSECSKGTSTLSRDTLSSQEQSTSTMSTMRVPSEDSRHGARQTSTMSTLRVPSEDSHHGARQAPRKTSEVRDVHTAFNKLDRALNCTLSPDRDTSRLENTGIEIQPSSPTSGYDIISSRAISPTQESKGLDFSSFEIITLSGDRDSKLNTSSFEVISYKLDSMTSSQLESTSSSRLESTTSPEFSKLGVRDLGVGDGYLSDMSEASPGQRVPASGQVEVDGHALSDGDRAVPDVSRFGSRSPDVPPAPPPPAVMEMKMQRTSPSVVEDLMGQLTSTKL